MTKCDQIRFAASEDSRRFLSGEQHGAMRAIEYCIMPFGAATPMCAISAAPYLPVTSELSLVR